MVEYGGIRYNAVKYYVVVDEVDACLLGNGGSQTTNAGALHVLLSKYLSLTFGKGEDEQESALKIADSTYKSRRKYDKPSSVRRPFLNIDILSSSVCRINGLGIVSVLRYEDSVTIMRPSAMVVGFHGTDGGVIEGRREDNDQSDQGGNAGVYLLPPLMCMVIARRQQRHDGNCRRPRVCGDPWIN